MRAPVGKILLPRKIGARTALSVGRGWVGFALLWALSCCSTDDVTRGQVAIDQTGKAGDEVPPVNPSTVLTFPVEIHRGEESWIAEAKWIDGHAVLGEDIILRDVNPFSRGIARADVITWATPPASPVSGRIPYYVSYLPEAKAAALAQAIQVWNRLSPIIQFVPKTAQDTVYYVEIKDWSSPVVSDSDLGMKSHAVVQLGANGGYIDTVIHELGHIAGLDHEMERYDRDDYIDIIEANLEGGYWGPPYTPLDTLFEDRPYDLDSVMHYRPNALGIPCTAGSRPDCIESRVYPTPDWRLVTIVALNGRTNFGNGYRKPGRLSFGDIVGIYDLYNGRVTQGADFSSLDLSNLSLQGYEPNGDDLTYVNFSGANLRWANLGGVNLQGANLAGADLTEADLRYADLSGAVLRGAVLEGAQLQLANLEGADLVDANLNGCYLDSASFVGASLIRASLEGVSLRGTDFSGSDCSGCRIEGWWRQVDAQNAKLICADLDFNYSGFEFVSVYFDGADLTGSQISGDYLPSWGDATCPDRTVGSCHGHLSPAPQPLLGPVSCNGGISVGSFVAAMSVLLGD